MNWRRGSVGYVIVFVAGILTGMVVTTRVFMVDGPPPMVEAKNTEKGTKAPSAPVPHSRLALSGTDSADSDEFDLAEGLTTITVNYAGHGSFWLGLSEVGGQAGVLAGSVGLGGAQLGPWKNRTMVPALKAGRYRLQIKTEGDWKLTVSQ